MEFSNQAQMKVGDKEYKTNTVRGTFLEDLYGEYHVLEKSYQRGQELTYVVTLANGGTKTITNLSVVDSMAGWPIDTNVKSIDQLPKDKTYRYPLDFVPDSVRLFENGELMDAPKYTVEPPLIISGITLPSESIITLIYKMKVNEYAPLGQGNKLKSMIFAGSPDVSMPVILTTEVGVTTKSVVAISKSMSPNRVAAGNQLTYTFQIENYGYADITKYDNVIVTDHFVPILKNAVAILNGRYLERNVEFTYDEFGHFSTTGGLITVKGATYRRDEETGKVIVTPGVATLEVRGTV